jgi:hypothetical protein
MATTTQLTTDIPGKKRQLPAILGVLARVDWKPYALIAGLQMMTAFVFLANSASGVSSWFDKFPLDDGWSTWSTPGASPKTPSSGTTLEFQNQELQVRSGR